MFPVQEGCNSKDRSHAAFCKINQNWDEMTVWNDIQVKWFLEAACEDNKQLGGMTFYVVFLKAEIVGGVDMLPSFS